MILNGTTYTFAAHGAGREHLKRITVEEASWFEVLQEFTDFLGAVYGYDISSQVTVDGEKLTLQ
jgi:hypothetical protein